MEVELPHQRNCLSGLMSQISGMFMENIGLWTGPKPPCALWKNCLQRQQESNYDGYWTAKLDRTEKLKTLFRINIAMLSAPIEVFSFYSYNCSPSLSQKYPLSLSPSQNIIWASASIVDSWIAILINLNKYLLDLTLKGLFIFKLTIISQFRNMIE